MRTPGTILALLAVLVGLVAVYYSSSIRFLSVFRASAPALTSVASSTSAVPPLSRAMSSNRGQVYFLSHGGPPTMFDTQSAPYKAWIKYGKTVVDNNPKGLVVVSAHWENPQHTDAVVVNEDPTNPLVYDFYGFPAEYYQQKFESKGNPAMLADVKTALRESGMQVSGAKRGLDHGVWVPFMVAFNGATDIPIIQVSLPGDSSPVSAAKLGRALASLRDQGYGIMGTGQAVHNLRDYMTGQKGSYGKVFLDAMSTAAKSKQPLDDAINLFRHPAYRSAHPTPEHLLPFVVAAAAVDPQADKLNTLYEAPDGALGWGMWMWKNAEAQKAVI